MTNLCNLYADELKVFGEAGPSLALHLLSSAFNLESFFFLTTNSCQQFSILSQRSYAMHTISTYKYITFLEKSFFEVLYVQLLLLFPLPIWKHSINLLQFVLMWHLSQSSSSSSSSSAYEHGFILEGTVFSLVLCIVQKTIVPWKLLELLSNVDDKVKWRFSLLFVGFKVANLANQKKNKKYRKIYRQIMFKWRIETEGVDYNANNGHQRHHCQHVFFSSVTIFSCI